MWLVFAALVSTLTFAAPTVTNSEADNNGYAQTAEAELVPGGSGRVNDIVINFKNADEVTPASGSAAASTIVVRLPDGLNFASAPDYLVTQATPNVGVAFLDSAGDPTISKPAVTMSDTNNDGKNDRALVTVASANLINNAGSGDTLTISIRVAVDADVKPSTTSKQASVIVSGFLPSLTDIVQVIKPTAARAFSAKSTVLPTVAITGSGGGTSTSVSVAKFNLTIPAGTTDTLTVTLKPEGNGILHGVTSTLKITGILSPTKEPLTSSLGGSLLSGVYINTLDGRNQGVNSTPTITLTVQNAPKLADGSADPKGFPDPIVVEMQVDYMAITATTAAKAGEYGFAVAGTAGIKGSAKLINVAVTGSKAAASGALTKIVKGGKQAQTLPSIVITENFDGNALATTSTITLKAGTGLSFSASTAGVTFSDGGAAFAGGSTLTASKLVLSLTEKATTKTITIKGLKATATAEGTLTLTVGGATIDSATGPKGDILNVATGIARGTTSVSYETKDAITKAVTKAKVGAKGTATSALKLRETTYGAITTANATGATSAYISFTATNAKISGVTIAGDSNYTGGTAPAFGTCVEEVKDSPTYVCPINTESSGAFKPGTATITANITYKADGAVGDVISIDVAGNADVSGKADVADIVVATESSSGVVPQVTIGSSNAQKLAPITVKRTFAGSTVAGFFRVIAPAGVKFANAGNITKSVYGGNTATVAASTFATNDTLVIYSAGSPTMTFTPEAIISPDVAAGDISVDIVDGNISGTGKSGVTDESINVAYAVAEIDALSAGKAITVGANYSATNTREGGVGDITAASSATDVATVAVDGDSITVTGVAAGAATITVTDSLGGTAEIAVTVTAALEQAEAKAGKTLSGADLPEGTAFTAGASSDGGATQATEFTTDDDVEIVATVTVGDDIVGEPGAIHIALMAKTDDGTSFSYLDEDGKWADWDITGLPGVHIDAEELAASYNVSIYSGKFAAGTYRIALAYSSDGEVYFTGKAITLTVTE